MEKDITPNYIKLKFKDGEPFCENNCNIKKINNKEENYNKFFFI